MLQKVVTAINSLHTQEDVNVQTDVITKSHFAESYVQTVVTKGRCKTSLQKVGTESRFLQQKLVTGSGCVTLSRTRRR